MLGVLGINMKKIFVALIMLPISVFASPAEEDFGEVAGGYVGLCYMNNILKKRYCPLVEEVITNKCENDVIGLLPSKYQSSMNSALTQNRATYAGELTNALDRGYKKTVVNMNGDKNAACLTYSTALNSFRYQKLEELKRLVKYLKWLRLKGAIEIYFLKLSPTFTTGICTELW